MIDYGDSVTKTQASQAETSPTETSPTETSQAEAPQAESSQAESPPVETSSTENASAESPPVTHSNEQNPQQPEHEAVPTPSLQSPFVSKVPVYHGIVDDVPVREPGYSLVIGCILLIVLSVVIYLLGSKDGAYVFSEIAHHDLEESVKDKVKVLLEKVARLRAQSSYDSAYVLLRDFHELHPEEPNVNRELGWHNMEKGHFVFAAEYYILAAEVTPDNSRLNYYRGELHLRWGSKEADSARSGSMDSYEKNKLLTSAVNHFEQSAEYFTKSVDGTSCYNKDSAQRKRKEAREALLMGKFKLIQLSTVKVLAGGNKSRGIIENAIDELEALLKEDDLPSDLELQIIARTRSLKREL